MYYILEDTVESTTESTTEPETPVTETPVNIIPYITAGPAALLLLIVIIIIVCIVKKISCGNRKMSNSKLKSNQQNHSATTANIDVRDERKAAKTHLDNHEEMAVVNAVDEETETEACHTKNKVAEKRPKMKDAALGATTRQPKQPISNEANFEKPNHGRTAIHREHSDFPAQSRAPRHNKSAVIGKTTQASLYNDTHHKVGICNAEIKDIDNGNNATRDAGDTTKNQRSMLAKLLTLLPKLKSPKTATVYVEPATQTNEDELLANDIDSLFVARKSKLLSIRDIHPSLYFTAPPKVELLYDSKQSDDTSDFGFKFL